MSFPSFFSACRLRSIRPYEEIFELGTDPLVPDWPDLSVKSVIFNPDTPEVEPTSFSESGIIIVTVQNTGTVDATGKICIKATSNSRTLKESIETIGVGQEKDVIFYYRYVSNNYCSVPERRASTEKIVSSRPASLRRNRMLRTRPAAR